jgi:hypothetical protein
LSSLTEAEERRFFEIQNGNWLYFQNVWIQRILGVVDDRTWHTYSGIICNSLEPQGNREIWLRLQGLMDPELVSYVDECNQ